MTDSNSSNLIERLAEFKGESTDKVKKVLRNRAINKAMDHLSLIGKSPFDIGEEKFEELVAAKEKDIVDDLKTKALKGLGVVALLLGLN